jgi:membrane protease YdiL (CAAX protease family)
MADTDDVDAAPLPPVEYAPLSAPPAPTHRVWTVIVALLGAVATSAFGGILAVVGLALVTSLRQRVGQGTWMSLPMTLALAHTLVDKPVGRLAASLAGGLAFMAFALIPASVSSELLVERLRLGPRTRWFAWGILAAWGLRGLADLTAAVAHFFHHEVHSPAGMLASTLSPERPGLLLLAVLVHGGVVAVGEELFFRGYAQTRLAQRWGPRTAVGVTAIAFATLHLTDPFHALFALSVGVFLGWVSERAGSVRIALVAHALHNATAVLATAVGATKMAPRIPCGARAALGFVALAVCVVSFRRLDPNDA